MDRVRHHGRETAYRRSDRGGGGPTALCIHGSGGASGVWKARARLADEAAVVALDLSGHGESDDIAAAPGPETLGAYADDAVAVARGTGARVLVGNSLGGAVAMWVALERDLDLAGLVLVGTGARLAVLADLLGWLETDFARAVDWLHGEGRLLYDPPAEYVELSRETILDTGRAVTERDFRTCHGFDVRDRLGAIGTPALAVVGVHDRLTPPWYHEYLADELPDCDLAHVEDAAHLAMLERPAALNAALRAFLARLSD